MKTFQPGNSSTSPHLVQFGSLCQCPSLPAQLEHWKTSANGLYESRMAIRTWYLGVAGEFMAKHLVVVLDLPLWKIWKSVGMMKFPIYGNSKKIMFQTTNQFCSGPMPIRSRSVLELGTSWWTDSHLVSPKECGPGNRYSHDRTADASCSEMLWKDLQMLKCKSASCGGPLCSILICACNNTHGTGVPDHWLMAFQP